ncbi:MAG TPA: hypothetical protein VFU54_18755 [Actinomycetota bacterium]|nr:hypothetical protein [Actinomycetota bacterium]
MEPAVGPLGQLDEQRVGTQVSGGDVELEDPIVADEHDELPVASACLEEVQLAPVTCGTRLGTTPRTRKALRSWTRMASASSLPGNWNSAAATGPSGGAQVRVQPLWNW